MSGTATTVGPTAALRVIVTDTDPGPVTGKGGSWWDAAVPGASRRAGREAERQRP